MSKKVKSVRWYQREIKDLRSSNDKLARWHASDQEDVVRVHRKMASIEQGAHNLRNRLNYEMGRADGLAAALATVAVAATRKDGANG